MTFLPSLMGAMAPTWSEAARGTFAGFTLAHTRGHFIRALLEGSAYAVRDITSQLQAIGVDLRELRVVSGGAKSRLWNQIKADVTGLQVNVPEITETTALGAAVNALRSGGTKEATSFLGYDTPLSPADAARYSVEAARAGVYRFDELKSKTDPPSRLAKLALGVKSGTSVSEVRGGIKIGSAIAACKAAGVEYFELPVAFDALTVVINPRNTWLKQATVAELKKLWEPGAQGKVTRCDPSGLTAESVSISSARRKRGWVPRDPAILSP